ncbi:MAG: PaaI family thioesterase [Zoogloeaceae bacterium]|jgi:acyl-coenzyme A thioesterase PaaI-like protein|nr:PaaI family thioesterase [Zoogloeaceae bacterium]
MTAFQDEYPEKFSHCFGCGRSHPSGLHLKSDWDSEGDPADTLVSITPPEIYSGGVPGHVYGGMIAALFDCHGTASAAAFACREEGRKIGDWNLPGSALPPVRYVTASLTVDYLRPTPQHVELRIRARLVRVEGRKVELEMTMMAGDLLTAKARMLAVRFQEKGEEKAA